MADTWADLADRHLAPLFADGRQPSAQELRDAYPFGERANWPYKVWLRRLRVWKKYGSGEPTHLVRHRAVAPEQVELFQQERLLA